MAKAGSKTDLAVVVPEREVVVVPDRARFSALVGTIEDRIKAFDQIAANLATLQLNGWDSTQKCKAACWLADGAGMHPAVFMQNHYCMNIQGKLVVEPKWEFIVGVLQSRVPGFQFKIEEETNTKATVWMSNGKFEVRKTYELEDARRLGLLNRGGNMLTAGATREWCLKQAIKKAGKTIGAAALMDLPVDTYEIPDVDAAPQPTTAEVIEEAIKKVEEHDDMSGAEPIELQTGIIAEPPAETPESPRARLAAVMIRYYGQLTKPVMLEKASLIYNALMKEKTGVDPQVSFKSGEIGPAEAEEMIRYIQDRLEKKNAPKQEVLDEAPVPESDTPRPRTAVEAYDALMGTVQRARKLFAPRKFIQESPPGSSKWWFVDAATFSQTGDEASIKLQVKDEVVAPMEKIEALNRVLSAACDQRERDGR